MSHDPTMTAREAADALGVSLATLYAYVSRGMITSQPGASAREHLYRSADVQALLERKAQRRDPARAAKGALAWGAPVLETAVSTILDGRLLYRGEDAVELARTRTFEDVAALLWERPFASPALPPSQRLAAVEALTAGLPPADRLAALLPLAALDDPAAMAPGPEAMARAGTRIVRLLAGWLAGRPFEAADTAAGRAGAPGATRAAVSPGSIAGHLAEAWSLPTEAVPALDAALILAADHELNVSAFTARCVASAGASPYDAVIAGLAALRGSRHGGHTERVEALFDEVGTPERAMPVLAARLRRGEAIPGFGQPLYPQGDPRGVALMAIARQLSPDPLTTALVEAGRTLLAEHPTIDFGLVPLARALKLPAGSAFGLFALGRSAGWLAHAIEQAANGTLIRPRAHYTGRLPG